MATLNDYIRPPDDSIDNFPYSRVAAKHGKMDNMTKIALISGLAVAVIAGLSVCGSPFGTTGCFVSIGGAALGAVVMAAACVAYYIKRYVLDDNRLQRLLYMLPQVETISEYLRLLDLDEANRYTLIISDLLKEEAKN